MPVKKNDWITKGSNMIHHNPYMRIVEYDVVRPNGTRLPYYVLDREDYAVIIPLDDEAYTFLIGQYRYAVSRYSWEFPAGYATSKTMVDMAKKELQQEAGIMADKWTKLGVLFTAPGHSRVRAHVYLAQQLHFGEPDPDPNEFVEAKRVSLQMIGEMISDGKIQDAPTICAYHLLEVYLEKRVNTL